MQKGRHNHKDFKQGGWEEGTKESKEDGGEAVDVSICIYLAPWVSLTNQTLMWLRPQFAHTLGLGVCIVPKFRGQAEIANVMKTQNAVDFIQN